ITNHSDPDVPDGVYIDEAFMNKATITELIANTVTADYVNAIDLNAISISGGEINIANKFTVAANGGVIARNLTVMNANGQVLMSSNANTIDYAMVSGGPPQSAQQNDYNYNNLYNKPNSIADIDGDGTINGLEDDILRAKHGGAIRTWSGTSTSAGRNNAQGQPFRGHYMNNTGVDRRITIYDVPAGVYTFAATVAGGFSNASLDIWTNGAWLNLRTFSQSDNGGYTTYAADFKITVDFNSHHQFRVQGPASGWIMVESVNVFHVGDVDKTDYDYINNLISNQAFNPATASVTDFNDWVSAWKSRADTVMTSAYIANLFAESLYANKIWAGEVYAHKLSGDVYEAVAKRMVSTAYTSPGSQSIYLFTGQITGFAQKRTLEIGSTGVTLTVPYTGGSNTYNGNIRMRLELYVDNVFVRTTPFVSASLKSHVDGLDTSNFFTVDGSNIKGQYVFEPLIYEGIHSNNFYEYEVILRIEVNGTWHEEPAITMFNSTKVAVFMNRNDTLT
ncbi:MAG: hypothetical protein GY881_07510, partial [Gammaproteobacteria bacterium]|nr:hypothetical protein [Gammaproteobacteria bacterium]